VPEQNIPEEHSLVRYVPWAKLRRDEDQNVIGVLAIAFELRPDEEELSANWLEFYQGDREARLIAMISTARLSDLRPTLKSGFTIGICGEINAAARSNSASIRILHAPVDRNDAHVELRRWPRENKDLFDLLADEVWADLVLTKDFP
jgi:hypothetical protein